MKKRRRAIKEALLQAGQELVKHGAVQTETMQTINQPIAKNIEQFHAMGNLFWKTCIQEGVTPKQFAERGLIPRPDSIETFMIIFRMGFNPKAAGDIAASLQFMFSGSLEGGCYFAMDKGALNAREGVLEDATLTIHTPFDLWMDILTGKADGEKMFAEEKYTVEGDLELLMQMGELFGGS